MKPMTTTSEKILSEMERMGRMKIKDLCAQIGWQYQKFRRRIKANDFSPEDLALIAQSMNTLQPYLPPTTVEALTGEMVITPEQQEKLRDILAQLPNN